MVDKNINKESIRELFIWCCIGFGLFIVFTTEFLSFFGLINRFSIFVCWIVLLIFSYIQFKNKFRYYLNSILSKINFSYNLSMLFQLLILTILILTLLTALIYPPNTPDSLSYHMSKVMHWIQNGNVEFYSTAITRQLYLSPFSEFVILHLQLLTNGDYLANLVQWFSMIGCMITVSLINKEFGGNNKSQLFSALFCATIPMGILQSTSTQTDYVVSLWIIILAYFIVRYKTTKSIKYIYAFAVALGLALITKQTAYIYALPFCVWFLFLTLKRPDHFLLLFTIPIIISLINFGQFKRNFELYGNPIGIHSSEYSETIINEKINIKTTLSNFTRNITFNLMVPNSKANNITRNIINKVHDYMKISIHDSKSTFGGEYWTFFSLYESYASNILHLLIIVFITLILILRGNFKTPILTYIINVFFGFLLFSIILKWNPWGNRLLLPLFILFTPIVGIGFFKIKSNKLYLYISIIIIFISLPYLLMNQTRPLLMNIEKGLESKFIIKPPPFLKNSRKELYFTYYPKLYEPYKKITDKIKESNCKIIGIDASKTLEGGTWEYPFWVMTKDENRGLYAKIFYFNVKNISNEILKNKFIEKPCAKVFLDQELMLSTGKQLKSILTIETN
jgi:4-amino-4-deoxy-L-arabinose transferase-like glycosyltransferase